VLRTATAPSRNDVGERLHRLAVAASTCVTGEQMKDLHERLLLLGHGQAVTGSSCSSSAPEVLSTPPHLSRRTIITRSLTFMTCGGELGLEACAASSRGRRGREADAAGALEGVDQAEAGEHRS